MKNRQNTKPIREAMMKKQIMIPLAIIALAFFAGCSTSYKATPLSFKAPSSYANAMEAGGAKIGARAFVDSKEAKKSFGFDIRAAGMLPVQIVFDHQGQNELEIDSAQTFLQDKDGNLWPILSGKIAYERATKYSQTKNIVKDGAYKGMLGAAAGSIIGAAIGVVSNENVLEAAGKGAAIGAAAGATMGGVSGYAAGGDARREIITDLQSKSLQNKAIAPGSMSNGIIFFPGEATSATLLIIQIVEKTTGKRHSLRLPL